MDSTSRGDEVKRGPGGEDNYSIRREGERRRGEERIRLGRR